MRQPSSQAASGPGAGRRSSVGCPPTASRKRPPSARRPPRRPSSRRRGARGALAAGRARPGGRVGQLVLDGAQRGLGPLDLALQIGGSPDRVLRRPAGFGAAVGLRSRPSPARLGRPRPASRSPPPRGAPRARASTRPSRPGSSGACRPPSRTCACPTASSSARSCETSSTVPSNALSASSSASRASMSRWLVGSSRISTFAPDATRIASESRRRSPPDRPSSGFSASSPLNRKRPSRARALFGVSLVARWAASSTVPLEPSSSACCER